MAVGIALSLFVSLTPKIPENTNAINRILPVVMLIGALLLLAFYVITGVAKRKLNQNVEHSKSNETALIKAYDEALSFGFKTLRLVVACIGSFTALTIVVCLLAFALGFQAHMETILTTLTTLVGPVWFFLGWKFFSQKLD